MADQEGLSNPQPPVSASGDLSLDEALGAQLGAEVAAGAEAIPIDAAVTLTEAVGHVEQSGEPLTLKQRMTLRLGKIVGKMADRHFERVERRANQEGPSGDSIIPTDYDIDDFLLGRMEASGTDPRVIQEVRQRLHQPESE